MSRLPEEAHVGQQSCTGCLCEGCSAELTSADEYTAGAGPRDELLCEACLPERWRSHYLELAATAEQDEEEAALAAREAAQVRDEATKRRAEARATAARYRAAAMGVDVVRQAKVSAEDEELRRAV